MLLRCHHDGSGLAAGQVGYALRNATANAHGVIAAAHAHFAKNVTLHDQDFNMLGRFSRIGCAKTVIFAQPMWRNGASSIR